MHTDTHSHAQTGKSSGLTLGKLRSLIRADLKAHADNQRDSIAIAVRLGEHLTLAKGMMPRGEFSPWMQKNFNTTPQWLRRCMRAYESSLLIEQRPDAQRIIANVTSVEGMANLLPRLKEELPYDDLFAVLTPRARNMPADVAMDAQRRAAYDAVMRVARLIRDGADLNLCERELRRVTIGA